MNEKAMNEKIDEQISALMDGELGSEEQEFLLRRLAQDERLQGKWDRYNLISDALQNHLPARVDTGLAQRIISVLEKEDALPAGNLQSDGIQAGGITKKLVKSVAGLSIAASVAVFSIIGIQQYNVLQGEENPGPVNIASITPTLVTHNMVANNMVTNNTGANNPITIEKTLAIVSKQDASPVYVRVSGTRWNNDRPQVGSRLNSYLVNHNEYTSATNLQGLVNYSRIAGYDVKK